MNANPRSRVQTESYLLRSGRNRAALDRAHLGRCSPPLLQHAGLEPFLDQSHDAPVRDAVLEKLHQPSVIERVEEATDVGIEHPVHPSLVDSGGQGIESVMWTSPRSE